MIGRVAIFWQYSRVNRNILLFQKKNQINVLQCYLFLTKLRPIMSISTLLHQSLTGRRCSTLLPCLPAAPFTSRSSGRNFPAKPFTYQRFSIHRSILKDDLKPCNINSVVFTIHTTTPQLTEPVDKMPKRRGIDHHQNKPCIHCKPFA